MDKCAAFESILYIAFKENHTKEMAEIHDNEEHTFSEHHKIRMQSLFKTVRRKEILITIYSVIKRVAAVIIIAMATLFGVLLTNADVYASIRHAVINWQFISPS